MIARPLQIGTCWDGAGQLSGPDDPGDNDGLGASGRLDQSSRAWLLGRVIELQVVPRLVFAHHAPLADDGSAGDRSAVGAAADGDLSADVKAFAQLVLACDDRATIAFVEAKLAGGVPLETLCLDLLAPTARHLGDLWTADACDFTAVTLGLCRLHRILRELNPSLGKDAENAPNGLSAMLTPVPGEQHTFGLSMVAEFFRRAGWNVWSGTVASRNELAAMVRDEWFAVIGFSLSCESRLEALAAAIQLARRESCNRSIGVLVGGRPFVEHPDLVARVGADAMAVDARQAPLLAQSLVAVLAQRN